MLLIPKLKIKNMQEETVGEGRNCLICIQNLTSEKLFAVIIIDIGDVFSFVFFCRKKRWELETV